MKRELHERLGRIIDLLDDLLDEDDLTDEEFHTLNGAMGILNDVYDEEVEQ